MSELKPCPFCGDDNLGHAADCYMALCKLPDLPSPAVMEAAWNRRTPQPVTPAGGEVFTRSDLNAEYARGRADGWEAHPPVADAALARHWIDRYAAGVDEELQMDRVLDALGVVNHD